MHCEGSSPRLGTPLRGQDMYIEPPFSYSPAELKRMVSLPDPHGREGSRNDKELHECEPDVSNETSRTWWRLASNHATVFGIPSRSRCAASKPNRCRAFAMSKHRRGCPFGFVVSQTKSPSKPTSQA